MASVSYPARVAELVDALVSGTSVFGRGGSSPLSRTMRLYRYKSVPQLKPMSINVEHFLFE